MEDDIFINDGRTATKTIPAAPGLHGECVAVYRPAGGDKVNEYQGVLATRNHERITAFEEGLLAAHVRTLNGAPFDRDKRTPRHLAPPIREHLVGLILSYKPADEAAHEKNFSTG